MIFKAGTKNINLPFFFPDATRAVVRSLDTSDIESTHTPGILVNTYHLINELGLDVIRKSGGIKKYMDWGGAVISDSGGFQVGSLVKKNPALGKVTDEGVIFKLNGKKMLLTPEKSIQFQLSLGVDMAITLDDFTDPSDSYQKAKETCERTIAWAKRSKDEFEKIVKSERRSKSKVPYLLGVSQGGKFQDLRKSCTEKLVQIGFDGIGYGGWPITDEKEFDYSSAKTIAENTPKSYFLYGLGVGKPNEIVNLCKMGYSIFDCVLPTRDARHGRLYVFKSSAIDKIDLSKKDFWEYFVADKYKNIKDNSPISSACDCLTCKRYSRSYLAHLFKIGDFTAGRLATIHNLRFYSLLMEKIGSIKS